MEMYSCDLKFVKVFYSLGYMQCMVHLKVHKREKFFGSDFEFFTIF
jgi:hypothetical protein